MKQTTYLSTFISGFGEVIQDAFARNLLHVKIQRMLDGLVVYQTDATFAQVQQLHCFNNNYLLLNSATCKPEEEVAQVIRRVFQGANLEKTFAGIGKKNIRSFRIMVSKENETVSIDQRTRGIVEETISGRLGLRLNRSLADVEFWFIIRSEGVCFLGLRATATEGQRKSKYAKGELRRELAYLLCLISEPAKTDIVLDPFCGSGAIPLERERSFPFQKIVASDSDRNSVTTVQTAVRKSKSKIEVHQWDALQLRSLSTSSITKIITDPPWGYFQQEDLDFENFYHKMLVEFSRILVNHGLAVVLTAKKVEFEKSVTLVSDFQLRAKHDI